MAGDWIPYTKDLPKKPEVLRLARALGVSTYEVVGMLLAFWAWADAQTDDGVLRGLPIDILGMAVDADPLLRFCCAASATEAQQRRDMPNQLVRALFDVGWLVQTDGVVSIPNFDAWMGNSAKRRLQAASRMRKSRSRCAPVTQRAQQKRNHRTEQNRRDISLSPTPFSEETKPAKAEANSTAEPSPTIAASPGKASTPAKAPGIAQDATGGIEATRRPIVAADHPSEAVEARKVVDHYMRAVRPEQTGRAEGVRLALELLLAGRTADELRRAGDGYADWCRRHDRQPRHRLSPKSFFRLDGEWQEFLAGAQPEAAAPAAVSDHVRAAVDKLTALAAGTYRDAQATRGRGLNADGAVDLAYYERRHWRELDQARRAGVALPWLAGREPARPDDAPPFAEGR